MGEHLEQIATSAATSAWATRNGHRPGVHHRGGDLNLLVPRTENGPFHGPLRAYQRSDKALALSLMEMYVQGVSTRKVASITETLCGRSFSSQRYRSWRPSWTRSRGLANEKARGRRLPVLFVDAMYEKVRETLVWSPRGALVMGVNLQGKREILAVRIADTENTTTGRTPSRSEKPGALRASSW